MTKRILTLLAIVILSIALTGCGGINQPVKQKPKAIENVKKKPAVKKVVQNAPLWYAKNKNIFEINKKTLDRLYKTDTKKLKPLEKQVVKTLKNKLGLNNMNLKEIRGVFNSAKKSNNQFILVGYHRDLSYVIYFNKTTHLIDKMICLKSLKTYDISHDGKTIVAIKSKSNGKKEIHLIDTKTKKSEMLDRFYDKYIDTLYTKGLYFSPLSNYIILHSNENSNSKSQSKYNHLKIYDTKTKKYINWELGKEKRFLVNFSPNEQFVAIHSTYPKIEDHSKLEVFPIINPKEPTISLRFGYLDGDQFTLNNTHLIVDSLKIKRAVYDLTLGKRVGSSISYIGFTSPFMASKNNPNLFYGIGKDTYKVFAVKDNLLHKIHTAKKISFFARDVIESSTQLYLFPKYEDGTLEIINISSNIASTYNFTLATKLFKAKEFYDAGFKNKALSIYKNLSSEKEFFTYIKDQWLNIQLTNYIKLLEYKQTNNIYILAQYILNALRYGHINEAKKALEELKNSNDKELYSVLYALYLAQIDKNEVAYNSLVEKMPFSNKIQELISKYPNSSLKIFKDTAKASLIFGMDKNTINYKELKKKEDFISFEGDILDADSKNTSKSISQTKKVSNKIELLD